MYSNYEINKKYAIRKLSIGAFSIAIGLFASNMNELPVIGTVTVNSEKTERV